MPNISEVEYDVVENEEIETRVLSVTDQKRIIRQIDKEYHLCHSFTQAKRKVWLERLKLYNNQKRDADAVGDPLMFTVFNTIHAALYTDRLMSVWEGRGGEGDEDVEENLNALANFDYDIMQKPFVDYEWNWDAEFFGRGLMLLMDFDRTPVVQAPVPEVIDPTTWIRDPRAASVNGDMRGRGAMRFGGREIGLSYWELKDQPGYFNVGLLKKGKETDSLMEATREARRSAQNLENFSVKEEELGKYDNYEFKLLEWYTHIKGKKYLVTLGNGRSMVIRYQKLDNRWPIIDRALYPMAHEWDGVSIPDLTEDKQRARAILINLGLQSAKSDVIPTYLFDQQRIKNKNDLNFKVNKFIPVDGRVDNAVMPVQKSTAHQYVNLIMDILDTAAQRATATPEIQQGLLSTEKRTLGEIELVSSKVDTRYSMSAKVYGWSEADFWRQWYKLYKKHFKDKIDEKIVRIQGAFAPIWRPLTRENIIAEMDPDVKIESKVISEGKRLRDQQSFTGFAQVVLQDPENNRRFIQKRLAKLQGMTKEEIDMMFPPTVDELQAEDENNLLNNEKLPKISIRDDHKVHLEIHAKANANAYTLVHVRKHKELMLERRNMPEVFPPAPMPVFGAPTAGNAAKGLPAPTSPTQ